MALEELERALSEAQKELSALEKEKRLIPALLMKAGKSGDSAQILELRQRLNDLPVHIEAAEIACIVAEIAILDALAVIAAPEVVAHRESVKQAQDRIKAAQLELVSIQRTASNADWRQRDNRQRAAMLRRTLEDMSTVLGKQPGSVVHSLRHPA